MNRRTAILAICTTILTAACAAPVDTSKSYSRGVINRGAIVPAETIRTFEYLNYYEQRFPEPVDQPLGLDLRLGNPQVPTAGGPVWLQIGVQAQHSDERIRTPLNLALVLDVSGSMDSPDKMPYLKQSLEVFLHSLEPEDRAAIVTYSTTADLLWPSSEVGDGRWISQVVNGLRPGGNTNLHQGLMMGLGQVESNFDLRRNNRVILLTDGIANEGVTSPQRIAEDASGFNQAGIHLSTIGLGMDFNDELLSTLAQQGGGAYHFIDSAQEMDKVFRSEVQGLVERVANDVTIEIRPEAGVSLELITGYVGAAPAGGAQVRLYDMGAGESQVVMARLHIGGGSPGRRPLVGVTLSYEDAFGRRVRDIGGSLDVIAVSSGAPDPLSDVEVLRNATIVRSAEALIAIDGLFGQERYTEAWQMASAMELELRLAASLTFDQQMIDDADLFARYQVTLANALGYQPLPAPMGSDSSQEQRWGPGALPTVELDR